MLSAATRNSGAISYGRQLLYHLTTFLWRNMTSEIRNGSVGEVREEKEEDI